MTDFADWQEPAANATALSTTNLVGTGLAREAGGNLDTHTKLLNGTQAGALIAGIGRTVGQEVAALIASGSAAGTPGGAPLLHGVNVLGNSTGNVIPANGSLTPANFTFTRPGYILRVLAQMSGVNAVVPTVKVHLQWRVGSLGSLDVDEQVWYVPAGGSSSQRTEIKGPVLGDTLNVTFTNGDAADSVTLGYTLIETTWSAARHDGRSSSAVGLQGGTTINQNAATLILASDAFTVAAGQTLIKSLPLYAGQADLWVNKITGTLSTVKIVPIGAFDLGSNEPVVQIDWTNPPPVQTGIILPRCWCTAVFFNNTAANFTAEIAMTALEYAS